MPSSDFASGIGNSKPEFRPARMAGASSRPAVRPCHRTHGGSRNSEFRAGAAVSDVHAIPAARQSTPCLTSKNAADKFGKKTASEPARDLSGMSGASAMAAPAEIPPRDQYLMHGELLPFGAAMHLDKICRCSSGRTIAFLEE